MKLLEITDDTPLLVKLISNLRATDEKKVWFQRPLNDGGFAVYPIDGVFFKPKIGQVWIRYFAWGAFQVQSAEADDFDDDYTLTKKQWKKTGEDYWCLHRTNSPAADM